MLELLRQGMRKIVATCAAFLFAVFSGWADTNGQLVYLTYNVNGNGAADWSTNAVQVQAIGRQITYLNPDIIAFNEISTPFRSQLTNWAKAFLSGYYIATNSLGDGFIQNAIASRYPILSSTSHLNHTSLAAYGYTASTFTRDLFEAQINVTNYPQPLHVFVAHLKATTGGTNVAVNQDAADKRAAEASAVSNYIVTVFLTSTNKLHPYILSGDMNESDSFPETNRYNTGYPIRRFVALPTGLQLTTPVNPITHTDLTESIRLPLDTRFDYVLPCNLLFSNIATSQVFRTDLLSPTPPNLNSIDSSNASDHLPVLMVFNNPYDKPFQLTYFARTNPGVALKWESVPGQPYRVQISSNLTTWSVLASNLVATNYSYTFTTNNVPGSMKFFRIYRGW